MLIWVINYDYLLLLSELDSSIHAISPDKASVKKLEKVLVHILHILERLVLQLNATDAQLLGK